MKYLKTFKDFQDEVENHCKKKLNNLWFYHKGIYLSYKFSKTPRFASPETPYEYGVFETCNETLFDMVGSKVLFIKLPLCFKRLKL